MAETITIEVTFTRKFCVDRFKWNRFHTFFIFNWESYIWDFSAFKQYVTVFGDLLDVHIDLQVLSEYLAVYRFHLCSPKLLNNSESSSSKLPTVFTLFSRILDSTFSASSRLLLRAHALK